MSTVKSPAIIFDLGGVLIVEAEAILIDILPAHLLDVYHQNNGKVFNRVFEFTQHAYNQDFKRMWFMGSMSADEIVQKVDLAIKDPACQSFFKNELEKELIAFGVRMVLLPENILKFSALHQAGIECIKQCQKQGVKTLILSNWDPKSFALIQVKFPELFNLFADQDIFIPSKVGFMKPDEQVFAHIMQQADIDADQLIFIDDGLGNVTKAQELGIKSVHHVAWDMTSQEIKDLI